MLLLNFFDEKFKDKSNKKVYKFNTDRNAL